MTTRQIIGLMGAKGSGKDTAASFLVQQRGFIRIGFADKLYREVAQAYRVTVDYLGDRSKVTTPSGMVEKKEFAQPELALANCSDPAFVQCALDELAHLGVSISTPLSPRTVMQLWGTEYRRKRGVDSYWLDAVQAQMEAQRDSSFVITDVRFPNEHIFVTKKGGEVLRIRNRVVEEREAANRKANGTSAHASETAVSEMPAHVEIFNEIGNLAGLEAAVLRTVDELTADA